MIRTFAIFTATFFATQAAALDLDTPFPSMSGGTISIAQWHGQPVLVVNTASMCASVNTAICRTFMISTAIKA